MKRIAITIFMSVIVLMAISIPDSAPVTSNVDGNFLTDSTIMKTGALPSAAGQGYDMSATQNLTRTLSNKFLNLSNTFVDPQTHLYMLDLSPYHLAGWTLYGASVDVENLTATLEKEVAGVTSTASTLTEYRYFAIWEYDLDLYYDELAQGFYNQSHDGLLYNYSINYQSPSYDPAANGYAYLTLRSSYTNSGSNMTDPIQMSNVGLTRTWLTANDLVNLSSDTEYYAVIDGSALVESFGVYPEIRWFYEANPLDHTTRRHDTDGDSWGTSDRPFEALLNYSYIPWNQGTNSPLVFSNPEEVSLTVNQTDMSGTTWDFNVPSGNIKSLNFSSNQSLALFYNLTLNYSKSTTATSNWDIPLSGDSVEWNATYTVSFPSIIEDNTKSVTIYKPTDWSTTGVFNSTDSSTNYDNYIDSGDYVTCSSMTNGTWTVVHSAHNYIVDVSAPSIASILDNVDITVTIEDEISNPATSGTTNLTASQEGLIVYNPPNRTIITGTTTYNWNVDSWTTNNGTFVFDVFWTNGTEAGYLTRYIVVYYPTSLTPATTHIDAFAESSFEVRVDFLDTYGFIPLNETYALVQYSFDGNPNVTLTDLLNRTWTGTVSTIGITAGTYSLIVYAEGFAIENQTQAIEVHISYDTLQLDYSWLGPNGNDITYLQNTNLTVRYNQSDGTPIPDATVNVTDGANTWNMNWDPVMEYYWITFNGTDFTVIPDTIPLTANAWKAGYESQVNSTISLTVQEETATLLIVSWSPVDLSVTFVENLTIRANYTMSGQPILGATLVVSFDGGSPVILVYSVTDSQWVGIIPADTVGLGSWLVAVNATRTGYLSRQLSVTLDIVEDMPELVSSWENDAAETDYDTPISLSITITDSLGSPVISSNVSVSVQGTDYNMTHTGNGVYEIDIDPQPDRGYHLVVVTLTEEGYQTTSLNLNLSILTTTEFVVDIPSEIYESEITEISIEYIDSVYGTAINWGSVNLTIANYIYAGVFNGSHFIVHVNGTLNPNFYQVSISGSADGCVDNSEELSIQVREKTGTYISITPITAAAEETTISIEATLRRTDTDRVIPYVTIQFELWVHFENDTVLYFEATDSTNEQGVALWPFTIPAGLESRVERLQIRVFYDGPPELWDSEATLSVPVTLGPVQQLVNFLFYGPGRYIIFVLAVVGIAVAAYNRGVKPKKRAARISLEKQLRTFNDLDAMQHFMAVYVNRGTCVFYHPFKSARIQADLISGFISAVTSVYGEIKGDGVQGTLEEIHYQGLRLNSYSGRYVLGILIMEKEMSPALRDRLQFFIEMFENEYESHLSEWTGLVDCFDPEWIVSNLMATFDYERIVPHTIDSSVKMDGLEKKIIGYIKASLGDREEREFLFSEYIHPIAQMTKKTPAEILDIFMKMEDKGIINPISIHTILLRQGLGLSGVDDLIDEMEVHDSVEEQPAPDIEEQFEDITEQPISEEGDIDETTSEDQIEPAEEDLQEAPEESVDEKDEPDPTDQFLADVESLLKKEKKDDDTD